MVILGMIYNYSKWVFHIPVRVYISCEEWYFLRYFHNEITSKERERIWKKGG
jgi:hypothetical protein